MKTNVRMLGMATAVSALMLVAGPVSGQDESRPVIEPADLDIDPAMAHVLPTMIYQPEPAVAERWQDGLADIEARYDTDLADLRAAAAVAPGPSRAAAERRLQARKLAFEIEVIDLQLSLLSLDASKDDASLAAEPIALLRESAVKLRALRERILAGGPSVMPEDQPHSGEE